MSILSTINPPTSPLKNRPLTEEQSQFFHDNGYLLLENFYNQKTEIVPIQEGIHQLIHLLIEQHQLNIKQEPFTPSGFDSGYQQMIAHDRSLGGVLYDAVKQIPAFIRLVAHPLHEKIMQQLRNSNTTGIAAAGYGIRIDNPNEPQFQAAWHQDYPSQLRSLDGIVFWSPLVSITPELGPVQLCPRSHKDGLAPLHHVKETNQTGAYALRLKDEQARINRYEKIAPLSKPGDLILMDYKTLHASGTNRSQKSRWSMQMRYFNFEEPTGKKQNWIGGYNSQNSPETVLPELFH